MTITFLDDYYLYVGDNIVLRHVLEMDISPFEPTFWREHISERKAMLTTVLVWGGGRISKKLFSRCYVIV